MPLFLVLTIVLITMVYFHLSMTVLHPSPQITPTSPPSPLVTKEAKQTALSHAIGTPPPVTSKPTASEPEAAITSTNGTYWLVIGINSIGRNHGHDYLMQTLDSISKELPSDKANPLYGKVLILVCNNHKPSQGTTHAVYFEAKKKFDSQNHPKGFYFEFIDYERLPVLHDTKPGATLQNDHGDPNVPGYRVRKQTRDIVKVVEMALDPARQGKLYLFLEDDMKFCPHGFLAIQYLANKADVYHPNWLALRASYGMNGIILHYEDLAVFGDYLLANQKRRPPDHLAVEWFVGETAASKQYKGNRKNVAFKYNIFEHIGVFSTLRSAKQHGFPTCYDKLTEPVLFLVEAWSPRDCPHDDIWPCAVGPSLRRPLIPWHSHS
jgi:hypothetical protein